LLTHVVKDKWVSRRRSCRAESHRIC